MMELGPRDASLDSERREPTPAAESKAGTQSTSSMAIKKSTSSEQPVNSPAAVSAPPSVGKPSNSPGNSPSNNDGSEEPGCSDKKESAAKPFVHGIKLQSFIEHVLDHSFENPSDPELLSSKPSSITSKASPSSDRKGSPDVDALTNSTSGGPSNQDLQDVEDEDSDGALVMDVGESKHGGRSSRASNPLSATGPASTDAAAAAVAMLIGCQDPPSVAVSNGTTKSMSMQEIINRVVDVTVPEESHAPANHDRPTISALAEESNPRVPSRRSESSMSALPSAAAALSSGQMPFLTSPPVLGPNLARPGAAGISPLAFPGWLPYPWTAAMLGANASSASRMPPFYPSLYPPVSPSTGLVAAPFLPMAGINPYGPLPVSLPSPNTVAAAAAASIAGGASRLSVRPESRGVATSHGSNSANMRSPSPSAISPNVRYPARTSATVTAPPPPAQPIATSAKDRAPLSPGNHQEQPMDLSLKRACAEPVRSPRPIKVAKSEPAPYAPLDLSRKVTSQPGRPSPGGPHGPMEAHYAMEYKTGPRETHDSRQQSNPLESEPVASYMDSKNVAQVSPRVKGPTPLATANPGQSSTPFSQSGQPPKSTGSGPVGEGSAPYPRSGTPPRPNPSSITALIGNHPVNDILYLHCVHCQSTYGSVHGFRKHFRNAHGYNPRPEDVAVQSISATKKYMDNITQPKQSHPSDEDMTANSRQPGQSMVKVGDSSGVARHNESVYNPSFSTSTQMNTDCYVLHCTLCGAQFNKHKSPEFAEHHRRHAEAREPFLSCCYCVRPFPTAAALHDHLCRSHDDLLHHICSPCSKAYSSAATLRQHAEQVHGQRFAASGCNDVGSSSNSGPNQEGHGLSDSSQMSVTAAASALQAFQAQRSEYDGQAKYSLNPTSNRKRVTGPPTTMKLTIGDHIDKAVERELTKMSGGGSSSSGAESPSTTMKGIDEQSVTSTMGPSDGRCADGQARRSARSPKTDRLSPTDKDSSENLAKNAKGTSPAMPKRKMNLMAYLNDVVERGVNGEPMGATPNLQFFMSSSSGTGSGCEEGSPEAVPTTTNRMVTTASDSPSAQT